MVWSEGKDTVVATAQDLPVRESVNAPTAVSAVSWRGLAVGIVCVAVTCVTVTFAELVVGKIQIGFLQLPPVVVGLLVIILGIQNALRRIGTRFALAPHELFTIYVLCLLASMISSRGLLEKLIPLLVVPNYDANAANNWQNLFFPWIKRWSVPWDPNGPPQQPVAERFFNGLRPGETLPWHSWMGPLLVWAVFVVLMFGVYLCLAVLLRKQWVQNERLAFPLTQLPLEMMRTDTGGSFLRNRLTWIGIALPVVVFGFNGFHQWYPSVPEITTDININQLFPTPPWNNLLFFHVYVSFAAIGFFYLLPTDLLFSLWFFYLMTHVADAISFTLGYQPEVMPMYGERMYIGYQIMGCYFVLVGYALWAARPHLWHIVGRAFSPRRTTQNDEELLSYPVALWGLVVCLLLAMAWMSMLGMAWWLALFELSVLVFVIALLMARSTSESGMLMTETCFRPVDVYRMLGDVRRLGGSNLTAMAFLDALWMRDQRGLVLTGFLDSMKLADGARVRRASLLLVFGVGIATAIFVAGTLQLILPYKIGAVQMYWYVYQGNPVWSFNDAATVLNNSRPPLPWIDRFNFLIGVVATLAIVTLRARLLWFPLHPLGYALCGSWTMMVFWFSCFVAWLCKVIILRYGGMRLFAQARSFFLGMVLGEFTMAVLWTLPSIFWRTPTPAFPWP